MTWAKDLTDPGDGTYQGPQPSEWDVVYLGGEILPGFANVTVTTAGDIDERKSPGVRLSTPIDKGEKAAKVLISLTVLPGMYDRLREVIAPLLRPQTKTGARPPLEIQHPLCELWGISVVLVESVTTPNPTSGGTMAVQINCVEWSPAPAQAKTTTTVQKGRYLTEEELDAEAARQPGNTEDQRSALERFAAGEQ